MFCQRGSEFFLLALCVGGGGVAGGGVRFSISPSVQNITFLLLINDWSL